MTTATERDPADLLREINAKKRELAELESGAYWQQRQLLGYRYHDSDALERELLKTEPGKRVAELREKIETLETERKRAVQVQKVEREASRKKASRNLRNPAEVRAVKRLPITLDSAAVGRFGAIVASLTARRKGVSLDELEAAAKLAEAVENDDRATVEELAPALGMSL